MLFTTTHPSPHYFRLKVKDIIATKNRQHDLLSIVEMLAAKWYIPVPEEEDEKENET